MILRIDDFPHGDLGLYFKSRDAFPNYDHRAHVYFSLEVFETLGVPYVLGVTPDLINSHSDLIFLRSLKHCEVALHGFSHGWHSFAGTWGRITDSWPHGGEFSGMPLDTVRAGIRRGLEKLSDFKITKFIAPFNVYTQELLDGLNEFGFEMIMGGETTVQFGMDRLDHGKLKLDLCAPPFYNDSYKILPVLDEAIRQDKTITLHWIYERPDQIGALRQIAECIKAGCSAPPVNIARPVSTPPDTAVIKPFAADVLGQRAMVQKYPIAIVTETMNYVSGGVRCIAEVLNRLHARGYDAQCYVTTPDTRCDWLKIDFPIFPISAMENFHGILISPYSPTAQLVAASKAAVKFYWVHSYEPKFPEVTGRPDSWRIMSEASYRLPNMHYFAVSSYVRMILDLVYKVNVLSPLVPGGVDPALFHPRERPPSTNLRLMFLSRGNEFRGANDVVSALKILYQVGTPNLEIYVMGHPLDMGEVPHVHVPPLSQPEFADLLGKMDVFVHPSHFEGLPLPPLEAMASRCAVISTYVGAIDYLLDGVNALVVPPKRPDCIADAISRLLVDTALREQISEIGYRVALGSYTWEHTADRFEEAIFEGFHATAIEAGQ